MTSQPPPEVVLSAERARVDAQRVPVERVRVRKRIVTEPRTLTVEVRREELVVERSAVPEGSAVPGGSVPASEDSEIVMILHEEVPEVVTRVVGTEQVRVVREVQTRTVTVATELAREQAEVQTSSSTPSEVPPRL